MTQKDIADKLGITDKAVSKWERDVAFPDTATIPKLAEILGVSVEELMQAKAVPVNGHKGAGYLINIILKAVPLAMGVAVTVTSILGELDMKSGFTMLGVGLACVGAYLLKEKTDFFATPAGENISGHFYLQSGFLGCIMTTRK